MMGIKGDKRVYQTKAAPLLWAATRILCNTHWRWDDDGNCYQTHGWTRDAHYENVRSWPAATALSSLLRAIREDDRLAGEPMLRLIALEIALEYVENLTAGLDRE